jgi:hypothetical protein
LLALTAQFADCSAALINCGLRDAAIYLIPSILLAGLIRFLATRHAFFFLFQLAGTICHEAAHFTVGWLTCAAPRSFSIIPRRTGNAWQLGAVTLTNVRWYNAAPAALAPMLIILIPALVAYLRTRHGLHFASVDIALAFLLAPQFLSFMPSVADWKIALHSWPYLILGAGGWWLATSVFNLTPP